MSRRRSRFFQLIRLEDRIAPAGTAKFANGQLVVDLDDAGNNVQVGRNATGNAVVNINGAPVGFQDDKGNPIPAPSIDDIAKLNINGGKGNDTIDAKGVDGKFGLEQSININGGDGNDNIFGAVNVENVINGGKGDDTIRGGDFVDDLRGGEDNDVLFAGRALNGAGDFLRGDEGDDVLNGGPGADALDGGTGKDKLFGNGGADDLQGDQDDVILDAGDHGFDRVRVAKNRNLGDPLVVEFDVASKSLDISAPGVLVSIPFPNNVKVEDLSAEQLGVDFKVDDPANNGVQFNVERPNRDSGDAPVPEPEAHAMIRIFLNDGNLKPGEAFQLFFANFPALDIAGAGGPDQFVIGPNNIPVNIKGGAGNDQMTVQTGGLNANPLPNQVQVDNRADINHQEVEVVQVNDDAATSTILSATLTESGDPVFRGAIVTYTLVVTNISGQPMRLATEARCNYPILRMTSDAAGGLGSISINTLLSAGALFADVSAGGDDGIRSFLSDDAIAPGATVTLKIAVLADRIGIINLQTTSGSLSPDVNGANVGASETTEVIAGVLDRLKVVNKDETTGKPAAGNHGLLLMADDGTKAVFSSDGKLFDLNANYVDQPGTDVYLFLGDPLLISAGADGKTTSNLQVSGTKLSRDGRFLAFSSLATNLIAGLPGNTQSQVWLRDLDAQTIQMVSFNTAGTKGGNGGSSNPAISDDGRWVAFQSSATDLVAGFVDANGSFSSDIYLKDMLTGQTILVSKSAVTANAGGKFGSSNAIVSGDGRFVVFESQADDLVAGLTDNTFTTNLFVFDRLTGATKMVDAKFDGTANGTDSVSPFRTRISVDGSVITFESTSTNLISGFVNNNGFGADVYAYFTATGNLSLVSGTSATNSANNGAQRPNLSADGSTVAWISAATDLVAGITNGVNHIYVRDLQTGVIEVATIAADGVTAGNGSVLGTIHAPELSTDGRFVAFMSAAKNLVTGYVDGNVDDMELYVRDRRAGLTTLINSVDGLTSGNRGHESSSRYFLSAAGDTVVFESRASDLITGDTNGVKDIMTTRGHVRFSFNAPTGIDITLRRNGANLEVLNTATMVPIASRNADATFEMNINNLDATLTIDFASGDIELLNGLTVAGTGFNAKIDVVGGQFDRADLSVVTSGIKAGFLSYDDLTINFAGIVSVSDSATTLTRTMTGTALAESIFVTAAGAQRKISGGAGPDWTFHDPALSLTIATAGGNDLVTILGLPAGYDTTIDLVILGGDGNDTLNATNAGRRVTLVGGAGNDTITGGVGNDQLFDGPGDDVMTGNAGNDSFVLTPGSIDAVSDSGGTDTLDFSFSDRPITVDYRLGTQQTITDFGDKLTITGQIENFVGSVFNDSLTLAPLAVGRDADGGPQVLGLAVGDALVVDCLGVAGSNSGGKVSVPGFADVAHSGFETVSLINTGAATPAKITAVTINDGTAQRSRVTSITLTFDNPPSLPGSPADGFQLKRLSDNAVVSLAASVSSNTVTLTFTGGPVEFGSLADGRYALTVLASHISNLDGDGNGVTGDDFTLVGTPANGLFRLFGDSNGNGQVGPEDFLAFRIAFLNPVPAFDFDNSGTVDAGDFLAFRLNFLETI